MNKASAEGQGDIFAGCFMSHIASKLHNTTTNLTNVSIKTLPLLKGAANL